MMQTNRSSDRVRALAAEGKLDAAEAARLLAAIETRSPSGESGGASGDPRASVRVLNFVINPFARLQTPTALLFGAVTMACGLGAAIAFAVRFDGFLDLHVGSQVTARVALLDQLASTMLPAFVLFAVARILTPALRLVDFFVVTMLARAPLTLVTIPLALVAPSMAPGALPTPSLRLFAMIALSLVGVLGHVTWLYKGFRTASGVGGTRSTAAFVGALIVAEVVSKIALRLFAL